MNIILHNSSFVFLLSQQVLSPDKDDPMNLTIVSQHKYAARSSGKHTVDVSRDPMRVSAGNVIGFFCPGAAIVIFDVVTDRTELAHCALLSSPPEVGQRLSLSQVNRESGTREYSFNALIVPGRWHFTPDFRYHTR